MRERRSYRILVRDFQAPQVRIPDIQVTKDGVARRAFCLQAGEQ